jgi:hypothetical protein
VILSIHIRRTVLYGFLNEPLTMSAFKHNYTLKDLSISATAPQDEINELLAKMGAIVIKGLLSEDQVSAMNREFRPYLDKLGESGSKDQW